MININLGPRTDTCACTQNTHAHVLRKPPLIIKIGSSSEHNARDLVNKSLSFEMNYLMPILFNMYVKENSLHRTDLSHVILSPWCPQQA